MSPALVAALGVGTALAARPPDEGRALRAVEALQQEARRARAGEEPELDGLVAPAGRGEGHVAQLVERMESDLAGPVGAFLARREVAGVVRGPDYLRVVFEGAAPLTVVVRRQGSGAVIDELAWSACGMCSEQERFVRDLLADVDEQREASHRLLPGLELDVRDWVDDQKIDEVAWRRALVRRNSHAGYLRWVLAGARVASSDGQQVRVELADRTETWVVRYVDGRWQLVYDRLPDDSPLRLATTDIRRWMHDSTVASSRVQWWLPDMRELERGQLVARDVVAVFPRPAQGDVVVYGQDLGRTWGLLARLDPDTGEVLFRSEVPTLSERVNMHPWLWRRSFRTALSPDGRRLAVGVYDRLWVLGVDEGEVQLARRTKGEVGALAWHGESLLVAHAGAVTRYERDGFATTAQRWLQGESAELLVWNDELVRVGEHGDVHRLDATTLDDLVEPWTVCCGEARGAAFDPSTWELCVTCGEACEPAWLWRNGELYADAARQAEEGVVAPDPSGRWLLAPWSGEGGTASLWDARTDVLLAAFSPQPLLAATWASDGSAIWALDAAGNAWRWDVAELAASQR